MLAQRISATYQTSAESIWSIVKHENIQVKKKTLGNVGDSFELDRVLFFFPRKR